MESSLYSQPTPAQQGPRSLQGEIAFGKFKSDHLIPAFRRAREEMEANGGIAQLDEPMTEEGKDYDLKISALPRKFFEGPDEDVILAHHINSTMTLRYNAELQRVEFFEKHPDQFMGLDYKNSGGAQILDVILHPEKFEAEILNNYVGRFTEVVKAAGE